MGSFPCGHFCDRGKWNRVTWRGPGDFSMFDHNFLHEGSALKFSRVIKKHQRQLTKFSLCFRTIVLASEMIPRPPAWCPSIYSLFSRVLFLDLKWDPKSTLLSIFLPTFCRVKFKIFWGSRSPLRSTSLHHSNLTALCSFFGSLLSRWPWSSMKTPGTLLPLGFCSCHCLHLHISLHIPMTHFLTFFRSLFKNCLLSGTTSGLSFKIEILLQPPAPLNFLFHFFLIVPMAI